MTTFIILAAAMVAAALLWLLIPFVRAKPAEGATDGATSRTISVLGMAILVPALAAVMYASLSNWDWRAVATDSARAEQLADLLTQLEARLQANPEDAKGWALLGRSYAGMERYPQAIAAYQRAYELTRGEDVEITLALGEVIAMADETQLAGRAGALFDGALARAPNHPKALWYGSMAALQAGDLAKARDRLQTLLAQGPPEEIRGMLQKQVQDLNEQLAGAGPAPPAAGEGAATSGKTIRVSVTLAPEIEQKLDGALSLFVLARDPAGGAPLAVQRHTSQQLPLTVDLSERDAMVPTRSLATAQRVQVVARLSRSGTPQAQSGDFFGQADYEFGKDTGTLNIRIDQVVP